MKHYKSLFLFTILVLLLSCKKQLDVQNPNQPTVDAATTESGFLSLGQGTTYLNGFNNLKYGDGVNGTTFFTCVWAFHDMMGDETQMEAANIYGNEIGCPDWVKLDDGTVVLNPNFPQQQKVFLRQVNKNAQQGQNPGFYEWAFMYSLIKAENRLLELVDNVGFSGNSDTKKNAVKAWCYWWKGFAYSRIGSMYYAGLINNSGLVQETNGNYVSHDAIIAESNSNLDQAANILSTLSDDADYEAAIGNLIPLIFQTGKGLVPTPQMWLHNINTLKARNLLVNTKFTDMTTEQWNTILSLTNDGITNSDNVFTVRSDFNGNFMSPSSGTEAAKTVSSQAGGNTYKVSERLIQDYFPGDKRLANNFDETTVWIGNSDRGNIFNTRWTLVDGGNGLPNVIVYDNNTAGATEVYVAVTYEENALMQAEAKINTDDINGGLAIIDALRSEQGAGLAPVANTGLTLDQANDIIRRERRIEMPFRGMSFYDARRYGIIYDVTQGGGRYNAVVIDATGTLNTNAIINYNYLDYWDVPDNELAYNPPADGSAPVVNPN